MVNMATSVAVYSGIDDVSDDEKKGSDMTRVTILFPPEIVARIRTQASQQATPFTILLRQWVVQRLEEEEREREQKRGYRSLESGEQAIQKACPECGDRHVALFDASTGASECRACGKRFFVNTKPRPEREKWEQKQ